MSKKPRVTNLPVNFFKHFRGHPDKVFFFDCFFDTKKKEIDSSPPFGSLTVYGRPHEWLNLDDVWAPQDIIVQNFVF